MNGLGSAAWPDRMYLHHGHTFFVEFKRLSGKLTALQVHIQGILNSHGFSVYTVRTREEFRSALRRELDDCGATHHLP